jgi:hypothetical protein
MVRRLSFSSRSVPLVLLGVTLAAYGLFAAQQGYAWDDWGIIGMASLPSPQVLIEYFAAARPLWGYFYLLTTSLIGTNPFAWQVFALITRWLAAVALWWCLRLIWPRQAGFAFWASVFALVYPGFSQHSIAIAYGHYSLMFAMYYGSLGLSIQALRTQRFRLVMIVAALILSTLQLFSTEYYFGLELLRPVLFWLVIGETIPDSRLRLRHTVQAYLPYGLVVIAFIIWRGFLFESQLYGVSLLDRPINLLLSLPRQIAEALWNSLVAAWIGVFRLPASEQMGTRLRLIYWAILLVVCAGLVFYSNRMRATSEVEGGAVRALFLQWFGVGGLALLMAGIPFYAARLPVQLKFPDDRFTQPFALGAALLLAAGLELLPRKSWRMAVAGLLAALAVGLQVQNAFLFREDWELQKSYFWQLTWRAPALQSGTTILSERSPFAFTDDDALTFPTDWTYAPQRSGTHLYQQVSMSTRLNFQPGVMQFSKPIEGRLLAGGFIVSSDALIVVQFSPPSCLRVLHPTYDADLPLAPRSRDMTKSLFELGFPLLRREEAAALPLSNVQRIIATPDQPARPPQEIFGREPVHQWCYYFEKADLARAEGDWAEVVRLGDESFSVPYYPNNLSEYLPFIEAYARLERIKDARQLTMDTAEQMPVLKPALCAVWQRISASGSLSEPDRILAGQIQTDLEYCPVEDANE